MLHVAPPILSNITNGQFFSFHSKQAAEIEFSWMIFWNSNTTFILWNIGMNFACGMFENVTIYEILEKCNKLGEKVPFQADCLKTKHNIVLKFINWTRHHLLPNSNTWTGLYNCTLLLSYILRLIHLSHLLLKISIVNIKQNGVNLEHSNV